jgi:hypothetical protein
MSADEVYTLFMLFGIVIALGLGYVTWVITRKEKQ